MQRGMQGRALGRRASRRQRPEGEDSASQMVSAPDADVAARRWNPAHRTDVTASLPAKAGTGSSDASSIP